MARVLVTWELGGGSGHVVPLRPIIDGLLRRGHSVMAAVRDVGRAAAAWAGLDVEILQAPFKLGPVKDPIRPPFTLAHLLHDVGFADELELAALVGAWRAIFDYGRPELILCDHSPTALLAARGIPGLRRAVMGYGFICPPDQSPLPNLRFWTKPDPAKLIADEAAVLARMNRVLGRFGAEPIERVTQIYGDADATWLTTFEELDHFPWRGKGARYWGAWTAASGKPPVWPRGEGPRIFAYLKDSPVTAAVLAWLAKSGHPAIVLVEGVDGRALAAVSSAKNVRVERERLDMGQVAAECDLAVLHAPHGTTAAVLLAGKPVMLLPVFLEQGLLAHAVCERMGAGVAGPVVKAEAAVAALAKLAASVSSPGGGECTAAARRFAAKYAAYDPLAANDALVDDVEGVLMRDVGTLV